MNQVVDVVTAFLSLFFNKLSFILDFFVGVVNSVVSLLPNDPFMGYLNAVDDIKFLKYLNWFIPIGDFIVIGETWLAAIAIFYTYSVFLRFFKAID